MRYIVELEFPEEDHGLHPVRQTNRAYQSLDSLKEMANLYGLRIGRYDFVPRADILTKFECCADSLEDAGLFITHLSSALEDVVRDAVITISPRE